MSIKIYEAYRLKRGVKLDEWLIKTSDKAERAVHKRLKRVTDHLMGDPQVFLDLVKEHELSAKRHHPDEQGKVGVVAATSLIYDLMGAQLQSLLKSEWDLRVWLNVYVWKNRYYVMPYIGSHMLYGSLDCLKNDPDLEDYCYFNNTDRPDNIPAREWGARRRVWNAMNTDKVCLTRYICDYDNGVWHRVNPCNRRSK